MNDGSDADMFPILFAFQGSQRFLTSEDAALATPEQRIASIWPYVCRRVRRFAKFLRAREYANYDPGDTAQELWLMLRVKDETWIPARGSYVAFAKPLIDRHLCTVWESSHTVRSPRNSLTRARKFEAESDATGLSDKKGKTYGDILRTSAAVISVGTQSVTEDHDGDYMPAAIEETPLDIAVERERIKLVRDAVEQGVMALSAAEARVIGRTYGLWGRLPDTSREVADDLGREVDFVKRTKSSASTKIRERLLAMGHPAVASDN